MREHFGYDKGYITSDKVFFVRFFYAETNSGYVIVE